MLDHLSGQEVPKRFLTQEPFWVLEDAKRLVPASAADLDRRREWGTRCGETD